MTVPANNSLGRGRDPLAPQRAVVVIPFRDRGRDPLRQQNLDQVLDWWAGSPWAVHVVDDGRAGDEQFNRSAAYNRGAEVACEAGADVVIYTEADMLIPYEQVALAVSAAASDDAGLVVPFTTYCYLSETSSELVRAGRRAPYTVEPERTMDNGASMGAVNVVSMASLAAIGRWDEGFEGNSYDDNAMDRAFAVCCGVRRHVPGPAWHLYHVPGHEWWGANAALTDADRAALEANEQRWLRYAAATTPEQIRALTGEARADVHVS